MSAFNFHHHWKFIIMIWASQEDIPTSFPFSAVFFSSVRLSFWQCVSLALDQVVSLLPEKSSARLWLVCQFSPVVFLGTAVHIRKLLFMPVFCSSCKNRLFPASYKCIPRNFIHLPPSLHWSDNRSIFPVH